jgi:diazepam-binding inhibitor (GABA receptor modulator, acyl-CoA-binding protein)
MELKALFDEAVLNSKTLAQKPSNDILLQLYALYKQATEGDINTAPPANFFDFAATAKFNARTELKGKPKEAAMQEYADLVTKLKA